MMSEEATITDIEESELSGDHAEMYLFQWLSSVEKGLTGGTEEYIKANQADVEAILVKIIHSPPPYPPPGRALRQIVARCLIKLYTRAETRTLFDTLQAFIKIIADFKSLEKDFNKIAAFSCVGDLMAVFGSQFMSFMAEITNVSLKTYRSPNSPLLRYHALMTLRKSLSTAKRAVNDVTLKDILKQMKYGLTDKCLPVQRAAAEVIIVMYSPGEGGVSVADIESIVALCARSLDSADQTTRHSLAQLAGHMLALSQSERAPPPPEPTQKGKKDQDGEDTEEPSQAHVAENAKSIMTPGEMLGQLSSQFNKPNLSRKTRVGIFDLYAALLNRLGSPFVESNYALIVAHLMSEIVSNPRNLSSRYEKLLVRSLVGVILRDLIGVRMLSEQGQIGAIQELSKSYIKRWPAMMPGQVSPNSLVLVIILRELAGLLQQLGNSPPPVQDAVAEPLVTLLAHPSHATRVAASWALRSFCYTTPLRLPKSLLTVLEMLQRDINSLLSPAAPADVNLRALGHAYGLAALVSIIPERPLYVSYDISAKVLDMAIQLLKRAGEHEVKVAGVKVEVAWISIASLMSLGPNFVRPHLPQLLVLWRNALPKPTSKDATGNAGRSIAEWMFLLHVRESALGAILCFLRHNSTLVTLDVARRIASVLSNALQFANNFVALGVDDTPDPMAPGVVKGFSLRSREALLRSRAYQCFTVLGFSGITDSTQLSLLQSVVSLFASPDGYAGSSVQAAIASSSGAFTSVWQSTDGYAYGITSIEVVNNSGEVSDSDSVLNEKDVLNRDTIEVSIDNMLRKPVLGACEHDPLSLCHTHIVNAECQLLEPPPPSTSVVDAAIELFSQLLPLQDLGATTRTVSQLLEFINSPKLERNTGRKSAIRINTIIALALALRHATNAHFRHAKETLGNLQLTSTLSPFLKDTLIDGDLVLRVASSDCIGRIASLAGTTFLSSQTKLLVDQVVSNRDPYARAGCALAFGAIYSHVGGLAAGPLLKTTVNVLMSLSNDPHPVVHFWALKALARVVNAASLAYAPFVSITLGILLKLYLVDTHELEGGSLSNANTSGDYPAYPVVCQIIDAVITVLGPDMQESSRTRNLVLSLVHEFSLEEDEGICVEAIKCIQHFLMFAPEHVDIPQWVTRFRSHLSSSRRPLKLASINALYQLVQKDALVMSRLGGDQLVEDLFGMLDDDSSVEGVRNVISSWLQQTVVHNPSAWIHLCQRIMSRTTASQQVADAANKQGGLRDDEGESLNVGANQDAAANNRSHLTSRWRTQLFALQCLHSICNIVAQSGRKEHVDALFARSQGIPTTGLLYTRVPDLIRMAFTASTAYVTEIRLEGLVVLRDVIQLFSAARDPSFEDALLLEQHQAPITAALTPAFSSDSTPEILASAVHACATFVGSGVVRDVSRMGRILKLLTVALEQSKDSGMLSIGETGELSPNASSMLRISTLSAWARLEIASSQQAYLVQVLKPHRSTLSTLWIASLRDYASIRAESEVLQDASSVALDSSYSSLGKEVLLPYYADSWPVMLEAVAIAMQAKDPHILAAMDGRELSDGSDNKEEIREGPTAFFFVIFGLVCEALASPSTDSTTNSSRKRPVIASLMALKSLVLLEYSGKLIMEPTTFDEFMSLCYRLAMTESASIQVHLVEMLGILSISQETGEDIALESESLSASSARANCLRICAYILRHSISTSSGPIIQGDPADRVQMITAAFTVFSSIGASINSAQQEDIRSLAILLYSELLKDETSEFDLVGPTLPILKLLLENPASTGVGAREKFGRLVHGLLSACLLNVDNMRGRVGVISTRKVKNNLLAAVLILTVIPPTVKVGKPVIEYCCFLISQKLLENDEISLTAAHCAKTLMVASTAGNALLRQCSKLLMPGLIEFIAKMAPLVNDGSISPAQASAIGEVWKAFAALFTSVAEEHRTRLLGVLLPTIALLLQFQQSNASPVYTQSVSQLLSFATTSPSSFKEAAAKLDMPTKELLEQSVRRAVGGAMSSASQTSSKPQISLRSF